MLCAYMYVCNVVPGRKLFNYPSLLGYRHRNFQKLLTHTIPYIYSISYLYRVVCLTFTLLLDLFSLKFILMVFLGSITVLVWLPWTSHLMLPYRHTHLTNQCSFLCPRGGRLDWLLLIWWHLLLQKTIQNNGYIYQNWKYVYYDVAHKRPTYSPYTPSISTTVTYEVKIILMCKRVYKWSVNWRDRVSLLHKTAI